MVDLVRVDDRPVHAERKERLAVENRAPVRVDPRRPRGKLLDAGEREVRRPFHRTVLRDKFGDNVLPSHLQGRDGHGPFRPLGIRRHGTPGAGCVLIGQAEGHALRADRRQQIHGRAERHLGVGGEIAIGR